MILDKEMELSNSQAVTVSAKSTNTYDNGPTMWSGTATGGDSNVPLVPTIEETFAAAGAATLEIAIRTATLADMSDAVVRFRTLPIPKAELVAGANLANYFDALRMPRQSKRYVDAYYTVATGPFTAGKISLRGGASHQQNR